MFEDSMYDYVSMHILKAFKSYKEAKVNKVCQTANGYSAIMTCALTGKAYLMEIKEIKSIRIVEKPLMFSDVIKEGKK